MSSSDPFETSDAAYVMDLLAHDERQAFEDHVVSCDACDRRVRDLQETAGLLRQLTEFDVFGLDQLPDPMAETSPLPETLLPSMLRRAGVARRRQRGLTYALSGLVAACLIALALIVVFPTSGPQSGRPEALAPLVATNLRATAIVSQRRWGTEIQLDCSYPSSTGGSTRHAFGLVAIDANGTRQSLGTWTVLPRTHTRFSSGTALSSGQVRMLQITDLSGSPILSLDV